MGDKFDEGTDKVKGCLCGCFDDFKEFLNRGSVVDLAIGLMMGAAFGAVVKSFVSDILTPIISLAGKSNMENMFLILRPGTVDRTNLTTIEEFVPLRLFSYSVQVGAQSSGAITMNYGRFFDTIINLIIIALVLFLIIKIYMTLRKKDEPEPEPPSTDWPCPKCKENVKEGATRCSHCTAEPIQQPTD